MIFNPTVSYLTKSVPLRRLAFIGSTLAVIGIYLSSQATTFT
jgi:hypothetical protein